MKRIDVSNKSRDELASTLNELRGKFNQLQFDKAEKKLKDSSQFKKIKKDIARILTALRNI